MKKAYFVFVAAALLVFAGAGCITIGAPQQQGNDGGVWKSVNKSSDWAQVNIVPTAGGMGSLNGINVADLVFDPQDNNAIYLASAGSGLFYTWDGAKSWKYVDSLGGGYVNSIAIDYKNKCVLYAALQNKLWKSSDCARSWQAMYYDTRANVYVSAVSVDPVNGNVVYAGLSGGDLIKSTDAGMSWSTTQRFNDKVQKIIVHPSKTNIIFAATQDNGLWKSTDSGAHWTDLRPKTDKFSGSNQIYDLDLDKEAKVMYLTSQYGIIVSNDLGENWQKVDLLTPSGAVHIYSFAVNPANAAEIYYSTASTFYSSFDGGKNWATKKLPSSRAGSALLVNPKDGSMLFLGTKKLE